MPVRLSGLVSGMDTEALVEALVSSYSLKKDNLVKAQTKLSWKQDSWKSMNKNIYGFYSGKLSAARMSNTYNLKSATISNSSYAKVTATSSAVTGTQTLEVNKLASTGYLTGGEISAVDENGAAAKVTGSTKLSSIKGLDGVSGGSISVTVDGKTSTIDITQDMTVNQFTTKLKEMGLNASFDESNQRFFISSKVSGADHDFSLTANNEAGLKTLQSLGVFTIDADSADYKNYEKWAAMDSDSAARDAAIQAEYEKTATTYDKLADEYLAMYKKSKAVIDGIESDDTWGDLEYQKEKLNESKTKLADYDSYIKVDEEGNQQVDENGQPVYDTDKLSEDEKLAEFNALKNEISARENNIKLYEETTANLASLSSYVTIDGEGNATKATAENNKTAFDKITGEVEAANAKEKTAAQESVDAKIAAAKAALSATASGGAVRISGSDSEIILNGAKFTSNTNNYSINGLTIQVTAKTDAEKVTITTDTDIDGIYNSIKDFLKEYNTLIKAMDVAYNAASSKGYEPLTSEEKEAMTEDEIEKWETKIKDSLLRKDSTLGNTSSALKSLMAQSFEINGKKYSLSSFGIKTLGYFESADNEKGVYHIDGDTDDDSTSGNEDKLRAMLSSDPETVISFFTQLANSVYTDLGKRMSATSLSSVYTLYNDKEMATEYSEYNTKISDMEEKITTWEDYYYKKFSNMESAMSTLNQTQSSLSGYFGG